MTSTAIAASGLRKAFGDKVAASMPGSWALRRTITTSGEVCLPQNHQAVVVWYRKKTMV
jgi:hypothetical protein